jgi:electron transport complex protein RnfG
VKKQVRDIFKPAVVLFLICLVVTAALAFTYVSTKEVIAQRIAIDEENARKEVLPEADSFEIIEDFEKEMSEAGMVKEAFKGLKAETLVGYVFAVDSKGYGGDMRVIVGITPDGEITGVKIGENNETPGLGSKAAEEPFISQFSNIEPEGPLKVVKKSKTTAEDIDAISGATTTTKAVVNAVQAALDMAAEISKEGGNSK